MIQPETWKAIGELSGKAWTAAGPLVGVLIGAWLGRAWDRKKWERDNRKDECRELIKNITHAAALAMNVGSGTSRSQANDAYMESIKTLHDRIFTAEDIDKTKVLDSWAHSVGDFGKGTINADVFSDRVDGVIKTIISFVIPRKE